MPLVQVPDPRSFVAVDYDDRDLVTAPPSGAVFGLVPGEAKAKAYWTAMQKSLVEELVRSRTTELFVNTELKAAARPGETREEFVARCHTLTDAAADKAMTALRTRVRGEARDGAAEGHRRADQRPVAADGVRLELRSRGDRDQRAGKPSGRTA